MALQMSWQPSLQRRKTGAPPLGLRNLGNTCYLNSVLQCLTYTPPLANFCLRAQHSRLCKKLDAGGEDKKRECPFCILEKRIARSLSIDGPHDAPAKIESCIRLFAEHFQWGRQEDAHEFLRYVIDACHNTCVKLLKATASGDGSTSPDEDDLGGREPNTVVREIFGGALLSQVKCLSCSTESNKTDEIMDISLDLYQSNSLRDALRRFFQPETLDGNNKYSCSSCKKLSEARKQMFILQAPNVLVIQLKRFEGMYGSKINKDVAFEEVLVLSSFMCKASQDPQPEYNLFGSIVHSGYSPESGHYYAYIKDPTGRWYCCNDTYVSLSTAQEVLSEKVYILFYLRSNHKPKSTTSGLACNGLKSPESNGNNARLGQKPSVNLRQSVVKQNGVLHPENCTPAMSSSPGTNGNDASLSQKSSISLKSPAVKLNGSLHPEKSTTLLKTNKIPSRPMINFALKIVEKRDAGKNDNGNVKVHSSATKRNGSSEQSRVDKGHHILPVSKSNWKATAAKDKESLGSGANASVKRSSDPVEKDTNNAGTISNENGCSMLVQVGATDNNNGGFKMSPVTSCAGVTHGHVMDRCISSVSGNKRKPGNNVGTNPPASSLFREDVSSRNRTYGDKYSPGGLEKYKEMIATEASSKLRACGWFDEVHNFMRARKRLCAEADGNYPDKTELKKLLIDDARKIFTSKLPNFIRQNLIDRLKSLSQGKALLDV